MKVYKNLIEICEANVRDSLTVLRVIKGAASKKGELMWAGWGLNPEGQVEYDEGIEDVCEYCEYHQEKRPRHDACR